MKVKYDYLSPVRKADVDFITNVGTYLDFYGIKYRLSIARDSNFFYAAIELMGRKKFRVGTFDFIIDSAQCDLGHVNLLRTGKRFTLPNPQVIATELIESYIKWLK